jgi:tripartite-type tricarboxylate transporter receptor subunit TctC
MTIARRTFLQATAAAAAVPVLTLVTRAQAYPARPVRIICAVSAGGTTDIIARMIAQWFTERLGQPFVVENRPGGGNNIGTEAAARSPADGYTLFMANSVNAINTTLYQNLNYHFPTDFTPIAILIRSPLLMQVHPSVPVKTVPDFIAYAKANSGKVNMGSGGVGASGHITGELFQMLAGIKMQHVPYRGEAPALTDLIGGQIQLLFATIGSSLQYVKAGRTRVLAVTTETPADAVPGVPPVAKFLPGFEASSWNGLVAPKGTPAEIIDLLNKETNAAMRDPKIAARFVDFGAPPLGGTAAEFGKIIRDDTEKWAKVIKFAGLKA